MPGVEGAQDRAGAVFDQIVRAQPERPEHGSGQLGRRTGKAVLGQFPDHPAQGVGEALHRGQLGERPVGMDQGSKALGQIGRQLRVGQVTDDDDR
ncbi:hypothetical protein [Streptomyces atroolivaceus]|uniref:hypothetical protein n=1 Tax=Streptomyces atroolivaceus TaxID=66869 RepID=UPI0036371AE2